MLYSLKIILRNLQRGGLYSVINIGGLSIGMAAVILLLALVYNEWSYDRFHKKEKQLYLAYYRAEIDNKVNCDYWTPKPMGPALKAEYPEVAGIARMSKREILCACNEAKFNFMTGFADPDFLTMFDFPLLHGDMETALNAPYSLILTEKAAIRLFGNEDPIGKSILINNQHTVTVAGIMKNLPGNTMFEFDILAPFELTKPLGGYDENWGHHSLQTYVELQPFAKLDQVNESIRDIINTHINNREKLDVFLYPLAKQHLYSKFENGEPKGGLIETLRLFIAIAGLILLIACINFTNLSTARSGKRAKEVGVHKVLGSKRRSLIGAFMGESMIISFIAGGIALFIAILLLPVFQTFMGRQLSLNLNSVWFWISGLGFVLLTGFLAGSYPAFYLSSFNPVKVLKGTFKGKQRLVSSRKILVVLQFTIATALIVSTLVIHRQIKYAQNRDTGYNKNQLIFTRMVGEAGKNYELIKNDLLNSGAAVSVTKNFSSMTQLNAASWGVNWQGKNPDSKITFFYYSADADWTKTVNTTIIEGRDIDIHTYATDSTAVVINETALKIMNFTNPIGEIINTQGVDWHVIGVVKDFIQTSPYEPVAPLLICGPIRGWFNVIHIKLNEKSPTADNLAKVEQVFKQYNSAYPFEYKFVDEEYATKFKDEQKIGSLITWFAGLTILISCMGLFALVAYLAETRRKEIGIRKVLGASIPQITFLLSKEFLILVLISIAIASPIAWYVMNKWLESFTYRTDIPWWLFFVVGGISLIIALLTVDFQAIKAATENPVKAIKSE